MLPKDIVRVRKFSTKLLGPSAARLTIGQLAARGASPGAHSWASRRFSASSVEFSRRSQAWARAALSFGHAAARSRSAVYYCTGNRYAV